MIEEAKRVQLSEPHGQGEKDTPAPEGGDDHTPPEAQLTLKGVSSLSTHRSLCPDLSAGWHRLM